MYGAPGQPVELSESEKQEWGRPLSKWRCHLFGAVNDDGIQWRPLKGQEPNFFWRWMQYLCFGNRWVKDR